VYSPQFFCIHHHPPIGRYHHRRSRQEGWKAFGNKWGIDQYLDCGRGLRMSDSGETMVSPTDALRSIKEDKTVKRYAQVLARIDDDGRISIVDLVDSVSLNRSSSASASVATPHNEQGFDDFKAQKSTELPPRLLRGLRRAWKAQWKRIYIKSFLRIIGIKSSEKIDRL
jgi:hypothetical protein